MNFALDFTTHSSYFQPTTLDNGIQAHRVSENLVLHPLKPGFEQLQRTGWEETDWGPVA